MTQTLPAPTPVPPADDEQPACGCPTHTTPGTLHDRITTVHLRTCPLYRAGDSVTRRYVPGTLDAVLDERFGAARAPELLAHLTAERFRPVTR